MGTTDEIHELHAWNQKQLVYFHYFRDLIYQASQKLYFLTLSEVL